MSGLGSVFKKKPKPTIGYHLGVSVNANNAFIRLVSDDNLSIYNGVLNEVNHYDINIFDGKHGQGANLTINAQGFNEFRGRVLLDPPARELPPVILIPNFDGPIRVEDRKFFNNKGQWRYKSVTGFLLLKRFLLGSDIEPFFKWMQLINANTVRIFAGWDPFFFPGDFNTYFTDIKLFARLAKLFDITIEVTIFASARIVFPTLSAQLDFYNKLIDALKDEDNIIYELVNENQITVNNIDVSQFALPLNRTCSRGSTAAEQEPVTPQAQYGGFHNGRDEEWPRRLKNASEFPGLIICGETTRPDQDRLVNSDGSIQNFLDAGMCAGLFVNGINGHSNALKDGNIPSGIESTAVEAIIAGFDRIPMNVKDWEYRRSGPDALPPAVNCISLRTFERRDNNTGEAYGVTIQRSSEMILENGWEFVSMVDNFYHIVRH